MPKIKLSYELFEGNNMTIKKLNYENLYTIDAI